MTSVTGVNINGISNSLGLKGSTTIYDYNHKKWMYTDEQDANVATLPASTFKILNSLIALEYKAVQDETEILNWDGKPKSHFGTVIKAWNKDTDMRSAYKNSTVWFYVEMAKRIGRKKYRKILKKCNYGNGNFSEKGTDFWNYGDFSITPKNQIQLLIKLYENELPFSDGNIDKVKEIMISDRSDTRVLRGKTGWTRKDGIDIGWWVGYVETTDGNIFFFATRLQKDVQDTNTNFSRGRIAVTERILNDLGVHW
ncbi:penicillin-binding transpeptidase domain-containing protein [Flagellimonas halotolerans]|uniref:Beta-lactamase n=1 Tax=Flagellimonas halotolerans TaxID=3112164 RepID=A0ABU6IRU5_9FLAO|nr:MULTISPECIES: penicillin-binding transpeptidase domain-containing protein [unclassified Allomuricauda]MEC3965836.1 penicillin-binding transpeptidase domain-containing protein [Muricauda sp. SYSU M86414]MEC4265698.1 penicillin-binding transpeptidase domain-containing protein [Muricauda sp. SYSU M84420]